VTAIVTTEGGRWLRAILYLVTITTGVWSAVWPSATLLSLLNGTVAIGGGTLLAAAGTCCLYGALRGRWIGEHIGLPFAIVATAGFAVHLSWTIGDSLGRGTVAGLAIMIPILLADRWRGVRILHRLSRQDARARARARRRGPRAPRHP